MRNKLANLDEVIQKLRGFLPQYLDEFGIDTKNNFSCLNPKHEDSNPSMSCSQNPENAYCFSCLEENELIWTTDGGLKRMKDLSTSDFVLDLYGQYQKIENIRTDTKPIIDIHLSLFRRDPLKLTKDHPCLVVRRENAFKYLPYITKHGHGQHGFYGRMKGRKRISKLRDKIEIEQVRADQVHAGDYFVFPVISDNLRGTLSLNGQEIIKEYTKGPQNTRIEKLPVNEETAYLYGLYLAEGSAFCGGVRWTLHRDESHTLGQAIQSILRRHFHLGATEYQYGSKPNTTDIVSSKTDLGILLAHFFGSGSKNKKIPIDALYWPKEIQAAFLRGWYDGDGRSSHPRRTPSGNTVSQKLVYSIFAIAIQCGFLPSLTKKEKYQDKNGLKHADSWYLAFCRLEGMRGFYEPINGSNYFWLQVDRIEDQSEVAQVVDITVAKTHTFTTKACAVHNCGVTADIFQAAHWLEDKPTTGPNFIEENVKYLAEKFGVELELEEMDEDELYRYRTYRAYRDAATLVANTTFGDQTKLQEEIANRKWEASAVKVGTVNYKDFRDALKAMGYEASFQNEIDLGRSDIFNEDNMIFTICDEWGRPVGFAARNLAYDENGNVAKYMNQKTTGLRCNIYQKGKRLYEIHTAIKFTPPLYIFEGYTDVLTAQNAGLMNCAAIGGATFTQQHIELLKRLGIYNIILVLDGDDTGRTKMADLLDNYFRGNRDMKVELVNMPDGMDPDDVIREQGLEAFLALRKWSAFEWRLNKYSDEDDPEGICKTMIPLIVNESSRITQDRMCSELALFTGIDKSVISSELERLQNEKEAKKYRERENIVDQMVSEIRRSPDNTKTLLYECASKIEEVEEKYNENTLSLESSIEFVSNRKVYEESLSGEFAGFNLATGGLQVLGEHLNGNWREDMFMCFGGNSNAGKTSLCSQLGFEIATGQDNNACVIYHSVDDSKEQILPRFVCQAYGHHDLTMNQVRNPNYFKKYVEDGEVRAQRRNMGYESLLKLMKEGRIILKDANDGTSFAFGESLIRYYSNKYPDRNIVYILDNLHKTPDFNNLKETRARFKELSNMVKATATKYHCCIIATVEYTKLPAGTIPNNHNIAETRAIMFDSTFIGHLYNDLHERGASAVCIHEHEDQIMPRIRLGIGKNKITEFKDRVFLDFFPASGIFKGVATDAAEDDMRTKMRENREMRKQENEFFSGNDGDQPEMPR